MITEKKCKGDGVAKGHGCGALVPVSLYGKPNRIYGLGLSCKCYSTWLRTTEEGRKKLERAKLVGKKKVQKEEIRNQRKAKQDLKLSLMSPDKYRAKYVQPLINKIARLIDYGQPCTPTGNYEGKMAGGHYTSVGANRTICLNLHNIFIQSFHSNSWKGGDDKKYRSALKRIFGQEYLDFVEGLNSHRPIKLTKEQLVDVKVKATQIVKELEQNQVVRTPEGRILLRNEVNKKLGVYELGYSVFNM